MSRKVRSARGEEVDFDLLQVKSNMQKTEKPLDVKTREDFVHLKRRRRGKGKLSEMLTARTAENKKQQEEELATMRENTRVHTKSPNDTVENNEEKFLEEKALDTNTEEKVDTTPKKKRKIVKKETNDE